MLTVKQAAAQAGVSESLVYQWIAEHTLPCYRLGGKGKRGTIRIAAADLDRLLASFKVGPRDTDGPHPAMSPMSSDPAASGLPASTFSELDPDRLARAWRAKPR